MSTIYTVEAFNIEIVQSRFLEAIASATGFSRSQIVRDALRFFFDDVTGRARVNGALLQLLVEGKLAAVDPDAPEAELRLQRVDPPIPQHVRLVA